MATTDFQSATNLLNRVLDKIKLESRSLETAKLAVIISILFAALTLVGIGIAFKTNAKVDYELQATRDELTESKNRTSLYIVYVQELQADLIIKGFEPPPLPEE